MAKKRWWEVSPRTIKWLWGIVLFPIVLLLLLLILTALGLFGRMPSFEELENPKSNLATEIYSEDGKVIPTSSRVIRPTTSPSTDIVCRPLSQP